MSRVARFGYRRDSGYQSIRLPYRTGKVAMYIVLPDAGVTFDAVARRLAAGHWAPSAPLIDEQPVHVVLPRFHSEVTMDLGDPLVALGLRIAFDLVLPRISPGWRERRFPRGQCRSASARRCRRRTSTSTKRKRGGGYYWNRHAHRDIVSAAADRIHRRPAISLRPSRRDDGNRSFRWTYRAPVISPPVHRQPAASQSAQRR